MIHSFAEIAASPELHVNLETVAALSAKVVELNNLLEFRSHSPAFMRADNDMAVRKSRHFMEAMVALTGRNAYSKADCAMLIAEQAYQVEALTTPKGN